MSSNTNHKYPPSSTNTLRCLNHKQDCGWNDGMWENSSVVSEERLWELGLVLKLVSVCCLLLSRYVSLFVWWQPPVVESDAVRVNQSCRHYQRPWTVEHAVLHRGTFPSPFVGEYRTFLWWPRQLFSRRCIMMFIRLIITNIMSVSYLGLFWPFALFCFSLKIY